MDNTFVILSYGEEELSSFVDHLNSIQLRIQFTMEKVTLGQLVLLDILVTKKMRMVLVTECTVNNSYK